MLFTRRPTVVNLRPSVFPAFSLWDSTELAWRLRGKMGLRAREKTRLPSLPASLRSSYWIYYKALEVSSLLFLLLLHCSLEKPTLAFIGQLRGPKASSSTGIEERSSCYLYLKRNGRTGTSPLPDQLLIPDTHTRHYGKAEASYWLCVLGKVT